MSEAWVALKQSKSAKRFHTQRLHLGLKVFKEVLKSELH